MPRPRPRSHQGRHRLILDAVAVIRLLRSGRWTIKEVAAELDIEWRTVYRIVESIQLAGIEVEAQREGVTAYYRVDAESVRKAFRL